MNINSLFLRTLTSILLIPVFLVIVLYGKYPFLLIVLLLSLLGLYEYGNLIQRIDIKVNSFLNYVFSFILLISVYHNLKLDSMLVLVSFFLLLSIIHIMKFKETRVEEIFFTLAGFIYIPVLFSFLIKIRALPYGDMLVIYLLLVIWANDSGAYFIGSKLGKKKLCPAISPNKTVEGALGGLGLSIITSLIAKYYLIPTINMLDSIVLALFIAIFGNLGDLWESSLKRAVNSKDSGTLLPGHGGILDRFDSLLFALPILYAYLIYIK